jgi:hypothetical protein
MAGTLTGTAQKGEALPATFATLFRLAVYVHPERDVMNRGKIAFAFAAGIGFMYFSDPSRGRRRRALARDKTVKTWQGITTLVEKAERDLFDCVEIAFTGFTMMFNGH